MTWHLCTIAKGSARNWELCKEVGLWGISSHGKAMRFDRVQPGDHLLIWLAGSGFVAHTRATGPMRRPADRGEAPWPEGLYRYGAVVPIEIELELRTPLWLPFKNSRQELTGLSLFSFRRGFIAIPDEAGRAAVRAIEEAAFS